MKGQWGCIRAKLRPVRWEAGLEQSADVKNGANQWAAALLEAEEEATAPAEKERMNYKLKKREDGFGYVRMLAAKTCGGIRKMVALGMKHTWQGRQDTNRHADKRTHGGKS